MIPLHAPMPRKKVQNGKYELLVEGLKELEILTESNGKMADQAVCSFVHALIAKAEGVTGVSRAKGK